MEKSRLFVSSLKSENTRSVFDISKILEETVICFMPVIKAFQPDSSAKIVPLNFLIRKMGRLIQLRRNIVFRDSCSQGYRFEFADPCYDR